jgi:amidase
MARRSSRVSGGTEEGKEIATMIERPTSDQLETIARSLGLDLTAAERARYLALMERFWPAFDVVDALTDQPPAATPARDWRRPSAAENRFNAWYVKTSIKGAPSGRLAGKRVALKDNVFLAGVPMMNGASILDGHVPDIDATLVTRILDAGGEIAGKAVCEYFCFSGGSHTSATGPVRNPHDPRRSTSGSSSGSAALVAAGDVDMAIGGDQAGSIRGPAAWCGIYGMKPTWGLVPYTGVAPIEYTLDTVGPMTSSVADNALLLEAIAGADGLDPRQYCPRVDSYTRALEQSAAGLRIGVLGEGFGRAESEPAVDEAVRAAARLLTKLGMDVAEVSVPLHASGLAIWAPIALEGSVQTMLKGNGFGNNHRDLYATGFIEAQRRWRERANEMPANVKLAVMMGEHATRAHGGRYYAAAMNLSRRLTAAYDAAFESVDLLLLPTVPLKPTLLPPADADVETVVMRALEVSGNTAPFNVSRHPALSLPCGKADGLPVGMMLVGRHYEEATIYRAAHAFAQAHDWRTL